MISKMWSKGGPGAWMLPMLFIRASLSFIELYHSLLVVTSTSNSSATTSGFHIDCKSSGAASRREPRRPRGRPGRGGLGGCRQLWHGFWDLA